jgi:azurin
MSSSSGASRKKKTGKSSAALSKKRVEPEGEETEVDEDQREVKRLKMSRSKRRMSSTLRRTGKHSFYSMTHELSLTF